MNSRRKFLKNLTAVGATVPLVSNIEAKPKKNKGPVILCSRGEMWGEKVLKPGWDILSNKGKLLDAIEISSNVTELDPEDTSVGYGGLPNEHGVVQLDASIMYGPTHNCGSVAALEGIKTPCSVARLVMERTDHIHIVGKGAQDFARAHGLTLWDKQFLETNNPHLVCSLQRNFELKYVHKNYETSLVFVKF